MTDERQTRWIGWGWFASIMILLSGALEVLFGILAILLPASQYFTTREGTTVFYVSLWGWWHLLIGIVLIAAGIALANGRVWARVFAVVVVAINAVSQLLSLPAQPWWSIVVFTLDIVVIYAITVHGRELRAYDRAQ
ncbi:hypothetical protein ASF88_11725 [Leifsonia sp. Leaf336]|uniref:DUF7144 family membrane protein n=1 Tax=Leifsonia sp. Leaf336 TaxID=1736341 RepID=UPI0006FACD18|nr:hypothetical protein [Leifsonia sp. Leaf336]KQR52223.1 hypothetical protein ASF88_11725 [Leifsonia sp. Leaf336]